MTTATTDAVLREEGALAFGVLFRYLSTAFRHPTAENLTDLTGLEDGVTVASAALADLGIVEVGTLVRELLAEREATSLEEMADRHGALYGHAAQGTVPIYETEYGDSDEGLQQPHRLGDLNGFFRAFGLRPSRRINDRCDHVAVEMEYVSYLCQKEAYALANGDGALADLSLEGRGRFLDLHLARWVPAFCRRLEEAAGDGFHAALARLALAAVLALCRIHDVEAGPDVLSLRSIPDDPEQTFTCPMATRSVADDS